MSEAKKYELGERGGGGLGLRQYRGRRGGFAGHYTWTLNVRQFISYTNKILEWHLFYSSFGL